jgi:hypothetical protein
LPQIREQNSTGDHYSNHIFSFKLDFIPFNNEIIVVNINIINCNENTSSYNFPSVFPSQFIFSSSYLMSSSKMIFGEFIIAGNPGCYIVIASIEDNIYSDNFNQIYQNSSFELNILEANIPSSLPLLQTAILSNNGESIDIVFDVPCDQGQTVIANYQGIFSCTELLFFQGKFNH